jgi:hypothetical protein
LNNSKVSINPNDSSQICVTGWGIFKVYRYTEGNFKLLQTPKFDRNIHCHCWTSEDRIVLGTEEGKIIVIECSGDIKWETMVSSNSKPKSIHSIASYSKGFIVGCSGGTVAIYERVDEMIGATQARIIEPANTNKDAYRKQREHSIADENGKLLNMAISLNEDLAIFSSDNCQIYSCQLSNAETKNEEIKLDPYIAPSHHV